MKIYTKRGDSGETDLFGGERVLKNHARVKAYGDIDCANTAIGLAYSTPDISDDIKHELIMVMKWLFSAGAEVATAPKESAQELLGKHLKNAISDHQIVKLEQAIDEMETKLKPLRSFILPCGSDLSARLHCARNMVRQAEISLIDLKEHGAVIRAEILRFFNRLSDYLFVLARWANAKNSVEDICWNGQLVDET